MIQNFLLIDGSYFVFFRFYALLNWFALAKKDQIIDKEHPPHENIEFVELFNLSEGRLGVIVTFLALLELVKESLIDVIQNESMSKIYISIKK